MTEQVPSNTLLETHRHIAGQLRSIADNIEAHEFPDSAELLRRYARILDDGSAHEPESAPVAWMRGFTSYRPGEPDEYDVECYYGDEPPADGLQWTPLYTRPAPPPATAQMTLARANEIAEDIAEAMRITSKGEWVIDLVGGPFTADQLEAIAVIMRNEASETKEVR